MNEAVLKIMPKMLMGEELDAALRVLPAYDPYMREQGKVERLMGLESLYHVFIPSQMSREIYSKLYLSMLHSLQKKSGILAVQQSYENRRAIRQQSFDSILGGSEAWTIIGDSGIGKSASVSRGLNLLMEKPFFDFGDAKVVPCLTAQTPADASLKGFLFEVLRKLDEHLETHYYEHARRTGATVDILIGMISQVSLSHVCLLVLDEIQNIVNSKNGKAIVGTLTQLINSSGISICMVGTPETSLFFGQSMILARRSLGLEYHSMPYDDTFRSFCSILYGYCYTHQHDPFDEAICTWLYGHSGGNASIVVSLIHDAQEIAILEGYEKLDIKSLTLAYERRLSMLHDYIDVPRMNGKKARKTKAVKSLTSREESQTDQGSDIYRTIMSAKEEKRDILEALKNSGISIREVAV